MDYDYLIVGSGLYGSVFTYEMTKRDKKCLVIEKRRHIGGNIYTENIYGINVHKYGPHIFHTSNKTIWEYMNQFTEFNSYICSPIAIYKDELYNLPFNMNTFNRMWKIKTPSEARSIIEKQIGESNISNPSNLEEQAIKLVGVDVYEKLIKGYTIKQWGKSCTDLPSFIIQRLPVRFTYDNNYFNDRYQGIPIGGYTAIIEKMLKNTKVLCNTNYFHFINSTTDTFKYIVFTGCIDKYFNYCFGKLEYRSLFFEEEILDLDNYQGTAIVNYTDAEIPYTRIIEHKHFEHTTNTNTIITREYPQDWHAELEPYYPINDKKNLSLYSKYARLAVNEPNIIFGGRLGEYKYYDMDKVVQSALEKIKECFA